MPRPKKPAALKQGKSETKAQLKIREDAEMRLMGNADKLKTVPDYLDTLAQVYYEFLVNELEISGLLTNLDVKLVEQCADAMSKLRQCDDIINREGIIISTFDGRGNEVLKEHPAVKSKMSYLNAFKTLSSQLGMSPASRAQLAGMQVQKQEEDQDPLLQLLKQA